MNVMNEPKTSEYLKEHTEEVLKQVNTSGPMVITQDGEASAVVMSYSEYKRIEDGIALRIFLDIRSKSAHKDRGKSAEEVFGNIKKKIDEYAQQAI